jgi:hypothetical protein
LHGVETIWRVLEDIFGALEDARGVGILEFGCLDRLGK